MQVCVISQVVLLHAICQSAQFAISKSCIHNLQISDLNLTPNSDLNPNVILSQIVQCILQIVQTHKMCAMQQCYTYAVAKIMKPV